MTASLRERIRWTINKNHNYDDDTIAEAIIKEIESTHRIVDPEIVTDEMLEACFDALPEHYDRPDPTRRPWHAFKAKRRFSAMVKCVKSVLNVDPF